MKKFIALILAFVCMFSCFNAFAADVSGYEAHATINLDPFKTDAYSGYFYDVSYSGELYSNSKIEMKMRNDSSTTYSFTFYPKINFATFLGIMVFSPSLFFGGSDYINVDGFFCVIGENRYLLGTTIDASSNYSFRGHITIGKNMYTVLKEIAEGSHTVTFCPAGVTSFKYTLTATDVAIIKQFVTDMETSGLVDQLGDDDVVIITQYN